MEEPQLDTQSQPTTDNELYYVPVWRFILLNFATLTFYQIYWGYRQWSYLKKSGKNPQAIPWLAALFLPLTYYSLLKSFTELKEKGEVESSEKGIFVTLVVSYIILNIFGTFDGAVSLVTLLSFWPLLYGLRLANEYYLSLNSEAAKIPKMPWWKRALVGVGLFLFILILPILAFPEERVDQFFEQLEKSLEEQIDNQDSPTITEELVVTAS